MTQPLNTDVFRVFTLRFRTFIVSNNFAKIHVMELETPVAVQTYRTKELRADNELGKNPENFELPIVEKALVVEPLLNAPELFNEEHPVMITELLLRTYPWVTQEIINRFQEARKQFAGDKNKNVFVNERMSPFRGNVTTAIFGPALQVFKAGGGNEEYRAKAKEIYGDSYEPIIRQEEKIMERINYRKRIGHKDEKIDGLISEEMKRSKPNVKLLKDLRELRDEIKEASKNPEDDLRKAFILGKLTSIAIREAEGKNQRYTNREELVEEFLKPVEDTELTNYDTKLGLLSDRVNLRSQLAKTLADRRASSESESRNADK